MARRPYQPSGPLGQAPSGSGGGEDEPNDFGPDFELATTDLEAIGFDAGGVASTDEPDTDANTDAGPRKRRPRSDAGVKRGPRKGGTKASISLAAVERLLFSSHMILATVLRTQELALSEEEAKQLAEATGAVCAHYQTEVAAKTIDWINFVQCAALIYGSRAIAWKARKTQEASERKKGASAANGAGPVVKDHPNTMPTGLFAGRMVN